jgi:L-fuconate dehydratase
MTAITAVTASDVRFPTSLSMDGSDAMNKDGDYSAAYITLTTDDPALSGFGFTFTIGRGNDLCVEAARQRALPLIGRDVDELVADLGAVYRELQSDTQLRWLGPEKGVVHLALAAVMNAVWDLAARRAGKPLWRLLVDMTPEQLVDAADLRYLSDAITRDEAIAMLTELEPTRAKRIAELEATGYPCYTTSAGWLGYSDDKLRRLCQEAVDSGYRHIKLKVGANIDDDIRRLGIAREVIGWDANLMIDANQVWDVPEAIEWVSRLAEFKPLWIEEPTSPDDVLGHAAIRKAVAPIGVATGEHGMNRVLFKQMFQAEAIDFCQLDAARLGSVNEILSVYFMARKFGIPVCPHAGGVGLCELVQHLSIFDYVAVSGTLENRVTEFVDHLHEHFVDPCIVADGAYVLPGAPGYSAEMFTASLEEFSFPNGGYWGRATSSKVAAAAMSEP